ncbi:MAG TPA: hypothetical protein VFQ42_22060 [Mycobacterium sp.]|nr:hypothetical protein [Mycobacterium sp.]
MSETETSAEIMAQLSADLDRAHETAAAVIAERDRLRVRVADLERRNALATTSMRALKKLIGAPHTQPLTEDQRAPLAGRRLHWCHWSQQPDIGLSCGRMTVPAWGQLEPSAPGVYVEDEGDLYTFEHADLVNCDGCREYLARRAECCATGKAANGATP